MVNAGDEDSEPDTVDATSIMCEYGCLVLEESWSDDVVGGSVVRVAVLGPIRGVRWMVRSVRLVLRSGRATCFLLRPRAYLCLNI
jgi:hypothetical protein